MPDETPRISRELGCAWLLIASLVFWIVVILAIVAWKAA